MDVFRRFYNLTFTALMYGPKILHSVFFHLSFLFFSIFPSSLSPFHDSGIMPGGGETEINKTLTLY